MPSLFASIAWLEVRANSLVTSLSEWPMCGEIMRIHQLDHAARCIRSFNRRACGRPATECRSLGQRHGGVVGSSYVSPEIDTTPAGGSASSPIQPARVACACRTADSLASSQELSVRFLSSQLLSCPPKNVCHSRERRVIAERRRSQRQAARSTDAAQPYWDERLKSDCLSLFHFYETNGYRQCQELETSQAAAFDGDTPHHTTMTSCLRRRGVQQRLQTPHIR
jgi:hypothetical protein